MATIAAVHKIDRSLSTSHFVTNRQSVTSLQLSNHGPRGRRGRRAITSIRDRDYQEEAEEDMADDNWVFDSLVCFLHGPVWNAPLQTFIEEKSIIFDPNVPMDMSNPEFIKLHGEFKNLVDFMLGSFMEEMQITAEKFEMACLEGRNQGGGGPNNPRAFHQRLFQQIWAANDLRIFIRMMTQRNVELQLQALDLIERRQSSREKSQSGSIDEVPSGASGGAADLIEFNDQGGDEALIESNVEQLLEESQTEAVDAASGSAATSTTDQDDTQAVADKFERLNLFFKKEKVAEEELKQRQDYLRAQRDKILEIKKRTRARQLNETVKSTTRPSSARVAQKIMSGQEPDMLATDPRESSLMLRRVLAKRLRDEVVDKEEQPPN